MTYCEWRTCYCCCLSANVVAALSLLLLLALVDYRLSTIDYRRRYRRGYQTALSFIQTI